MRQFKKNLAVRSALAALVSTFVAGASASDLAKAELVVVSQSGIYNALSTAPEKTYGSVLAAATSGPHAASSVSQRGDGNRTSITQSGPSQSMRVIQQGNFNIVSTNQTGPSNSLELTQSGNRNEAVFIQPGNSNASLSQTGDLHRANIIQLTTSPNITIHQNGVATIVQTTQY